VDAAFELEYLTGKSASVGVAVVVVAVIVGPVVAVVELVRVLVRIPVPNLLDHQVFRYKETKTVPLMIGHLRHRLHHQMSHSV